MTTAFGSAKNNSSSSFDYTFIINNFYDPFCISKLDTASMPVLSRPNLSTYSGFNTHEVVQLSDVLILPPFIFFIYISIDKWLKKIFINL